MPALIENHFIYIAQPPLFRVTRKKTSRYIHSEREMDEYLISLGLSDVHFRMASHNNVLEKSEVEGLLTSILAVEALISSLDRKGVPFREFLGARNSEGALPRYLVHINEEPIFVFSKEEFIHLREQNVEAQRQRFETTFLSVPEAERAKEMPAFHPKALNYMELYEEDHLENLKAKLAAHSLTLHQYIMADGKILDIVDENHGETPIYMLKEIIDFVRENGRKGIEIQRYKGLGEMNADQLWETTMDPAKRTLLQVTRPDAVAADYMFTMLMGEEVPPRRAFIESHALSVKNLLDI